MIESKEIKNYQAEGSVERGTEYTSIIRARPVPLRYLPLTTQYQWWPILLLLLDAHIGRK